jgi:hypothetical protein
VARDIVEEESDNIKWGQAVHKAMALRLSKGVPLPKGMEAYEHWCARILAIPADELMVEQKMAIDKSFGVCDWRSDFAWYRGIGDVVKLVKAVALVVDWKTGKIVEDSCQLALMASCVFARYPTVRKIRSEFIWLKEDATTSQVFDRTEMPAFWTSLLPRVRLLQHAAETQSYPAKPGYLCRNWCPVTSCPHHGE